MASIYRRGDSKSFWGKWTDAAGDEHRASLETTDEDLARKRLAALERDAKMSAPKAAGDDLTVKAFALGEWLTYRKKRREFAWKDDVSRLTHHFFPKFGARPLRWLETDEGKRAIGAWLLELPDHVTQRDGKPLGTRTVWNIVGVVKVLLRDAWKRFNYISRTPFADIELRDELPKKTDKGGPDWRETAYFELDQVAQLTTDPRLQPHRRLWNTLAFLVGGARTGELANLRWKDWTASYKGGLGRMRIATSFNTRAKKEKPTKTGAVKLIPVHPFAAASLTAWRASGWREWIGRDPTAEDFIIPRGDGRQWDSGGLLKRHYKDLELLGLPKTRQYDSRATFRNLLTGAGADEGIVNAMTHPSPRQASDFYNRVELRWPAMCGAILLLDHAAWRTPPAVPADGARVEVTVEVTGTVSALPEPSPLPEKQRASRQLVVVPPARLERAAYGLGNRVSSGLLEAGPALYAAAPTPTDPERDWFVSPERSLPLRDVPGEALVDALLEAEVWALDARLARAAGGPR